MRAHLVRKPVRSLVRRFAEQLEDRTTPATFTVSSTAYSGPGTFQQAILDANAAAGADTIQFNALATAVTLTANLPTITDSVTINAGGATISGNSGAAVVPVAPGATAPAVMINNATFTAGAVLTVTNASLTLSSVALVNNLTNVTHAVTATAGKLALTACTVTGNGAGGVNLVNGSSASVTASTLSDNKARAIRSDGSSITLVDSTLANNSILQSA